MTGNGRRIAIAGCCLAVAWGCFDEPVRQHLHLHLAAGAVVAVWTHEVDAPDRAQGNPAIAGRMDTDREALARALTPATGWFERARSAADRSTLERIDGLVRRGRWTAAMTDEPALQDLLADLGLTAFLAPTADVVELVLEPTSPTRATRAQRQLAEQLLDSWSADVARYLTAAIDLYGYLDRHPSRAAACLAHLFEDDDVASAWPVDDREAELVAAVGEAADDVAEALMTPDDRAWSLNELSRLAHDPFPARLTLSAPGGLAPVEGLRPIPGGLERPPVSVWQALLDLEGTWIEPDLVTAMVAPVGLDDQPDPDPVAFAARPRRYGAAPTDREVADALRSGLAAVGLSIARWPGPAPGDGEPPDARALLDSADAAVPR